MERHLHLQRKCPRCKACNFCPHMLMGLNNHLKVIASNQQSKAQLRGIACAGSPKKSHTSTASAGAAHQLPSAAAAPPQGTSPGRSRRQVTLTPKAQELLAQASSGVTATPPQWPFTVDALAPPHQQLQQQLHQQHLQQQLMMQRQQYHLQQQQLQQQQLQQQQLLQQQHQQQLMAPIVPRRPRSDLANHSSSPRRPRVSDFSYPSHPGSLLQSSAQSGRYPLRVSPAESLCSCCRHARTLMVYLLLHNKGFVGLLLNPTGLMFLFTKYPILLTKCQLRLGLASHGR